MTNKFWVDTGGTPHWSLSSGGPADTVNPVAGDNIFYDENSGTQVAGWGGVLIHDLNFTNYTGNLTANGYISLTGSLTLSATMTITVAGAYGTFFFRGTGSGNTITTAGQQLNVGFLFNGEAGSAIGDWTFLDDATFLPSIGGGGIMVYGSTVNTNGMTITLISDGHPYDMLTVGKVYGTYPSPTLNLGSSDINLVDGAVLTIGSVAYQGQHTFDAGTSTITFSGDDSMFPLLYRLNDSASFNNVIVSLSSSEISSELNNYSASFNDLTIIAPSTGGIVRDWIGVTSVSGTLTLTGFDHVNRLFMSCDDTSIFNIYASTLSISKVTFKNTIGGPSTWTGTDLENYGGNTNITFTPAVTRTVSSSGGNWTDTTTWGGQSMPLAQDTVVFNGSSGNILLDRISTGIELKAACSSLSFSTYSGTISIAETSFSELLIYNNSLTLNSTMSAVEVIFTLVHNRSSSSYTINPNGGHFGGIKIKPVKVLTSGTTCSYTLSNNLSASLLSIDNRDSLVATTFSASSYTINVGMFTAYGNSSGNANGRMYVNMGSGEWTLNSALYNGNFGDPWITTDSDIILNAQTANILVADMYTSVNTFFYSNGKTFNKLTISGSTPGTFVIGCDKLGVVPVNTFSEIASTHTGGFTISIDANYAATSGSPTLNVGAWSVSGVYGDMIVLTSQYNLYHTLNYTGASTVTARYLNISNSHASPSTNKWYASNSINSGNNNGWNFIGTVGSNLFFGSSF